MIMKITMDDFYFSTSLFKKKSITVNTLLTNWKNTLKHVTVSQGSLWIEQIQYMGEHEYDITALITKTVIHLTLRSLLTSTSKSILPTEWQLRQKAMASTLLKIIQQWFSRFLIFQLSAFLFSQVFQAQSFAIL